MPREQNPASTWPQGMHHGALGLDGPDEDFTKFLDLDNGFEQFQQVEGNDTQSSLETPTSRLAFGHNNVPELLSQNQEMLQNMDITHYQPYQMYPQLGHSMQYQVPLTPVSAEMHATKYTGQIDNTGQLMFDRHQASFTPLVSPAQTPLDNAFGMQDYVMADEFFSPLTSPAIEAQTHFTSTNTTASPVDLNGDPAASSTPGAVIRKRGKKVNQNQTQPRPPVRNMKHTPTTKSQPKRRQSSLNAMSHEKLRTMLESTGQQDKLRPDIDRGRVCASSEDSVSPEPLSELLMRPPPVPSSSGRSPSQLEPQSKEQNLPATPAMIMRMPSNQPGSAERLNNSDPAQGVMEDIALPDAAAALPMREMPRGDARTSDFDDQTTPTLLAKTPKLNADSTPRTSATRAQNNSSESVDKLKRSETRIGGRGNKKRQSVLSSAVSPALRPKMSPSISPLAPATGPGVPGLTPETSALFLASKSNYQNILDGTHLPGVSYPEALAENLSSKRTSHKIAEQGRRNRINLALKEIESLLPASVTSNTKKEKTGSTPKENEEGSPDKVAVSNQGASKASTVEMAIVYIKSLQDELRETKERLEAAEKTIATTLLKSEQNSE